MKIVTDCAADMSNEELKELGVTQAPLYIQFPEGEVSSLDISADAFYDRLGSHAAQHSHHCHALQRALCRAV